MARCSAIFLVLIATITVTGCEAHPPIAANANRITAAATFTKDYEQSRLRNWKIRASAAGTGCDVLFVETGIILEDSMIEALHYGAGDYEIYPGGIQQFFGDRGFRGVAYKDASDHIWTYGAINEGEAQTIHPCKG